MKALTYPVPGQKAEQKAEDDGTLAEATYGKVIRRLIPFLFVCYIVAFLDRVNIGFAKLQMLDDLKLSEAAYGLGAGIFFAGYFLFEIPSNLMLHRTGARRWIARIMVSWAIVSGLMAFVTGPTSFYILRFLLGVAEAGFFPGIILYLSYWFPRQRRAKVTALFMLAVPMAGVIGGPLSGWILQAASGWGGFAGWQWLLVIEALPAAVMGVAVLFYLDNGPGDAKWLTASEKAVLQTAIAADSKAAQHHSAAGAFKDGRVWLMSAVLFCNAMGNYALAFWLPSIVRATGVTSMLDVGFLTAIPFAFAAVTMVLVARSSDRHRERRWHCAIPAAAAAAGLVFSVLFGNSTPLALAGLSVGASGILGSVVVFWCLPTAILSGAAAAAGIGLINSIGNAAGFFSPYMIGWILDMTGSTNVAIFVLAGVLFLGGVLVVAAIPKRLVDR